MTNARSGRCGSWTSGKPKSDGSPSAMSSHVSPQSSERYTPPWNCMNSRSGASGERYMLWMHRSRVVSRTSSGTYRGTSPLFPLRHDRPPSSEIHTPTAEMPMASRSGSPGHGLPVLATRLVPECTVQRPGSTPILASKQCGRGNPGPHDAILFAGMHDPDPFDGRVLPVGEPRPVGLRPLFGEWIIGEEEAGPVLTVGNGGEIPPRPWIADRVFHGLSGEPPGGDVHRTSAIPSEDEQSLPRPHEHLRVVRATGDGGQHVDPIASSHRRVGGRPFLVHEHGDVWPDLALIVEDPSDEPRIRALQRLEELSDRGAIDLDLATPSQVAKRRTKGDDGHSTKV